MHLISKQSWSFEMIKRPHSEFKSDDPAKQSELQSLTTPAVFS